MKARTRVIGPLLALVALALGAPPSHAAPPAVSTAASPPGETTSPAPAPEQPAAPTVAPTGESAPAPAPAPAPAGSGAPAIATTPQVQAQRAQGGTPGGSPGAGHPRAKPNGAGPGSARAEAKVGSSPGVPFGRRAGAPSALTPSLPLALSASISGVPSFFIESFRIPPFLLSIYQAAGTAYGIPWQVLAAINEVETDYGRDLSVSSAGAEGWMQFLPAEWAQYGVDANGDGFKDPYNPADAIFAAARYLRAAGGDTNIRAAVYAYNHSQGYVSSVMLRAQLLGGTPPGLLGGITALTQARFPVHAAAHFSDGFPTVPASGSGPPKTLAATTIYSSAGAPVIAVADGQIMQVGDSPALGRFVSLRDAYGNTFLYGQLGDVAQLYPVLVPHDHSAVSPRIAHPGGAVEPAPSGPATAGAQPRSPLSEAGNVSGLALGAAAVLESAPSAAPPSAAPPAQPVSSRNSTATVRSFREGPNDVYLHPLRAGVQVIAGTVLGHLKMAGTAGTTGARATGPAAGGAGSGGAGSQTGEPHVLFQIRPAGVGAPFIDPKPILDGWVALENTSIFRAKGQNPFLATSPTVGQVLLESKQQLEPQVLHDTGIRLGACGRHDIQTGRIDKRVLATLEFLSVSGLKPIVSGLRCGGAPLAAAGAVSGGSLDAVDITSVNGIPIAGHQGPGSIADITVRKLLTLQGVSKPLQIVSLLSYPGAANALARPGARGAIKVSFRPPVGPGAHVAQLFDSALTPGGWIKLIARLGEIPNPTVASAPSAAAIPDKPGPGKEAGGNH
jgi:hypothetical protein